MFALPSLTQLGSGPPGRYRPTWLTDRTAGMEYAQIEKCSVAMKAAATANAANGSNEYQQLRAIFMIANLACDMGYRRHLLSAGVIHVLVDALTLDAERYDNRFTDKRLGERINHGAALALANLVTNRSVITHDTDKTSDRGGQDERQMEKVRTEVKASIEAAGGVEKLIKLMHDGGSKEGRSQAYKTLRLMGMQGIMSFQGREEETLDLLRDGTKRRRVAPYTFVRLNAVPAERRAELIRRHLRDREQGGRHSKYHKKASVAVRRLVPIAGAYSPIRPKGPVVVERESPAMLALRRKLGAKEEEKKEVSPAKSLFLGALAAADDDLPHLDAWSLA